MKGIGDYISQEALLSATEGYDWQAGLKTVLKRIPAAGVLPTVQCKDCKFAHFGPNWITCQNLNGLCTASLRLEDSCSRGERRSADI